MHELSICYSLMNQVKQIAHDNHAKCIDKIFLQIGPLSGIEPKLLQSAFPFASVNTVAEKACLIIESLPIRVHCQRCHSDSDASVNRLVCAECGDWRTSLISGDELLLERVEMQTEH